MLEYAPAPGQFINNPAFNDPTAALGPPLGSGTAAPNNESVVSLGGFGGSITLGFDQTVMDHPHNPFGLDAIVFGNAFYPGGDPARRFAEAGIIEISRDVNGNGLPDDPWYVIRGSSLPQVPGAGYTQPWDNDPGSSIPPANVGWYPDPWFYPDIGPSYQTTGYLLPAAFHAVPLMNPGGVTAPQAYYGYADLSPTLVLGDLNADNTVDDPSLTPEEFYTRPDNPFVVGILPGSGGGDAFDIAWAVDPMTGHPANLDGFDFIRIRTGVNTQSGILGEISTEVNAVAAVTPTPHAYDLNADGELDAEDLYAWYESPIDLTGEGLLERRDGFAVRDAVRYGEQSDVAGVRP